MNWVTVLWAMNAAACLTLAGIHALIGLRQRQSPANLLFALLAASTAGMAASELAMMYAATPAHYTGRLNWFQGAVWIGFIALVLFIRLYLRAGRIWLMAACIGLRSLVLAVSLASGTSVNYREITDLEHIPFLGESVAVPVGLPNPWMLAAQLSLCLLLAFIVEATWVSWKRGNRRAALLVGGGTLLFVLASTAQAILVFWGLIPFPITSSLFFTGLVVAMGYDLSSHVLDAAELSHQLQERDSELQQERALTDAVFDSVPGLLYLYSADGKLLRWNRQHESRTGYTASELASMNASDWFLAADQQTMRAAWEQVLAGGNVTLELPVQRKDGSTVPYLLTGVRLMIHGNPHLVGIGVDISQLKQAEAEAARQQAVLAHLSRVASLSELSGTFAHELNQPLAIILSNAQAASRLLSRNPTDVAELRDILTEIIAADRRASQVITRLRALLKRGEADSQPLELNEVVHETMSLLRSSLLERGITSKLELAERLPKVHGDRIPLQQVLINLVANACDAMATTPPAGRCLTIATRHHDQQVAFSVSDTGCGLPQDPDRIFESFFTTKPNGLGMGLAICRTILNAHGGHLWAEPNPDQGATLHVALPATASPP